MPVQLDYWHWWILATIFVVLEILAPTVFFLWMGVAAGVVGLELLVFPDTDWRYQVLLFSVLSIASIVAWRAYLVRHPTKTDRPTLNRRGEQYVGRVFTLEEPIVNGVGRVRVGDTHWLVSGEDSPRETRVRVVGSEGATLRVERV